MEAFVLQPTQSGAMRTVQKMECEYEHGCVWRESEVGCRGGIKVNGSGRGRPLYIGERAQDLRRTHEQAARGVGGNDVHGEGGAEGFCYSEALLRQPALWFHFGRWGAGLAGGGW